MNADVNHLVAVYFAINRVSTRTSSPSAFSRANSFQSVKPRGYCQ
jgi:hypothetical protein